MSSIWRSRWWPIATYIVMAFWLFVVNHSVIGWTINADTSVLVQLDGLAHFSAAMALATTYVYYVSRKSVVIWLLGVSVIWEILEVLTRPLFAGVPVVLDMTYAIDTMEDLALDIAGILVGVHFGLAEFEQPRVAEGQ